MYRRVAVLILGLALLATPMIQPRQSFAAPGAAAPNQVPDTYPPYQVNYFSQTGHAAVNWFWDFWKRTPNALFVLGYPISAPFIEESFTNPGTFYRVQYFERAVLEEHPENFGSQGNRFYILGRLMGTQLASGRENEPAFQDVANPGDGSWDALTKQTLRDSPAPFRSFWLNNGGLEVFGRPLSEQFQEVNAADGKTYWVQYFERQRMEWHPDEPDPRYRVLLGLLGNEYRDRFHRNNAAFRGTDVAGSLPRPFVYGFNAHLYGQGSIWQDRNRVLTLSKNAGIYWIRQQIAWQDLQSAPGTECYKICWAELDNIVADAETAGVNLLLGVVRAPGWATADGRNGMPSRDNFDEFARFMSEMAKRYKGRVEAYQIWNEQNLAVENGGRVSNADFYVDLLEVGYDAVKAADPAAIVVSGGPTATETNLASVAISDITYNRQMFANPKFRAHVDVIGAHPGGHNNPPDTLWPERPGPGPNYVSSREFYFRRLEDLRSLMLEYGLGDRVVWVTEFGWATRNNTRGYEFGNDTDLNEQAQYIVRAFQMGRRDYAPWIGGMFLWNLNFAVPWKVSEGNELHEQASFGVLNGDWSPRPSYTAIQGMAKD